MQFLYYHPGVFWMSNNIRKYRSSNIRDQKKVMVIIGDGPSECTYFDSFSDMIGKRILTVKCGECGRVQIIKKTKGFVRANGINVRSGDRVAIVTDEDLRYTFDEIVAFQKDCEKEGFELYLSNISFEVWLLMHYKQLNRPYTQDELEEELQKYLGHAYVKSKGIPFDRKMLDFALRNASEKLDDNDKNVNCFERNPSTMVHKLIETLDTRHL